MTYQILAGHRRVRAAIKAGIAKITATVLKLDDARAYQYVVGENLHRRNFTGMELYDIVRRFREQGLKTRGIANNMSKSESWVNDVFRIKNVDRDTRKIARAESWTLNKLLASLRKDLAEDHDPDAKEKIVASDGDREVVIIFTATDYKRLILSLGETEKRIQAFNDAVVRFALKWSRDAK
jgi:ParB family transcriptional regulator, chromosome partitioning protein